MARPLLTLFVLLMLCVPFVQAGNDWCDCHNSHHGKHGSQGDCGNLEVTRISDLLFPSAIAGISQSLSVQPTDSGAATFRIKGRANKAIKVKVIENPTTLVASTGTLPLTRYYYGGSINANGYGYLDNRGELSNVRIGGLLTVTASSKGALYTRRLTLNVEYLDWD